MVEKIKTGWWKTGFLYFQDMGREGDRKTRTYNVMTKNKFALGTVRWEGFLGMYAFYPNQKRALVPRQLVEIAEFASERTYKRPGRLAEEKAKKERAKEKRRQKYKEKRLTKEASCDTIGLMIEVPRPENLVVEGVEQAETPLVTQEII